MMISSGDKMRQLESELLYRQCLHFRQRTAELLADQTFVETRDEWEAAAHVYAADGENKYIGNIRDPPTERLFQTDDEECGLTDEVGISMWYGDCAEICRGDIFPLQ